MLGGGASKCWGGAKHVGGVCTNEVGGGGVRTPPENPPVSIKPSQRNDLCSYQTAA